MTKATILITDDETYPRRFLRMVLEPEGCHVLEAESAAQATALIGKHEVDLVFIDIRMPGEDGLTWLRKLPERSSSGSRPDVVVITGHGTINHAVEAMKLGAIDFMEKPFDSPEAVSLVVERVMARRQLSEENRRLRRQLRDRFGTLLGLSPAMQTLYEIIDRVAPLPITALILGESGTGKELVARTIHERSERSSGAFVAVNCAGLPESLLESALFGHEKGAFTGADRMRKGYFEEAQGGTLFLDEIGDMPMTAQSRLLRVLQERRFTRVGGTRELDADVRLLAATHQDLPALVAEGVFREDLYYRLKVVEVLVPTLRARGSDDIEMLARAFLSGAATRFGRGDLRASPGLMARLQAHRWPGNVRELKHTMDRLAALATGDTATESDLPSGFLQDTPDVDAATGDLATYTGLPLEDARARFEERYLRDILHKTGGNVSRAAELAGIARQHLHRKLKRYAIQPALFK